MVLLLAVPSLAAQDAGSLQQHSQLQQRSTLSQPNYLRTNLQVAGFIGGLWSYDRYVTKQPWAVLPWAKCCIDSPISVSMNRLLAGTGFRGKHWLP
jgi:hypothetical protein